MLTSDDGIDDSPAVSNHENVFWVREELVNVDAVIKHNRIFRAENVLWLDIFGEEIENVRGEGRVDDAVAHAGPTDKRVICTARFQSVVQWENVRNECRLWAAAKGRVGAEYDSHESGARTRHAAYPNDRRQTGVLVGLMVRIIYSEYTAQLPSLFTEEFRLRW